MAKNDAEELIKAGGELAELAKEELTEPSVALAKRREQLTEALIPNRTRTMIVMQF